MAGDTWDVGYFAGPLYEGLHKKGYLEMIYNKYETPMWYFCEDIADTKTKAEYELIREDTESGEYTIRIHNVGESFLNPLYETLELKVKTPQEEIGYPLPETIAPGTSVDVTITAQDAKEAVLCLENEYGRSYEETRLALLPENKQ